MYTTLMRSGAEGTLEDENATVCQKKILHILGLLRTKLSTPRKKQYCQCIQTGRKLVKRRCYCTIFLKLMLTRILPTKLNKHLKSFAKIKKGVTMATMANDVKENLRKLKNKKNFGVITIIPLREPIVLGQRSLKIGIGGKPITTMVNQVTIGGKHGRNPLRNVLTMF